jgi:hypothetical protein
VVRRNLLRQQQLQLQEGEGLGHAIPPGQQGGDAAAAAAAAASAGLAESSGGGGGVGGGGAVGLIVKRQVEEQATTRIKWRFLASEAQMDEGEELVDLQAEVNALMARYDPAGEGPRQMALDPI